MTDSISAIYDDMQEYKRLCAKWSETPRYKPDFWGNDLLDCYGDHAKFLKELDELDQ